MGSHDALHFDARGSCVCGCGSCRATDGHCRCPDCPCAAIDRCEGEYGTCMICRPVWGVTG